MVEHRKYLPQELDYVLSRVAAGWKFDIIAKAFKKEFASHWAYRLFTKKQVQYIKNTYRRPPGTVQPYQGPIPVFSPSPSPRAKCTRQSHVAELQATMNAALNVDRHGQLDSQGRQQANNVVMRGPSQPSSQPTVAGNGYQGHQQHGSDEIMFTNGPLSPYDINTLIGSSSGQNSTMMTGALDPALGGHTTEAAPYGVANNINNNYQSNALLGNGTQFPQMPQWTETAQTPSAHARFSGYASQLEGHFNQPVPSLENSLLNSAAPDHVLSGEHTERLLRGPAPQLERVHYDEGAAGGNNSAQMGTPETLLMSGALMSGALGGETLSSPPSSSPHDIMGCSIENTAYTDRSGWWFNGYHDGWCRIPHEHRHDYDGGVYFSSYDGYTQNIYNESNDQLTGFMLGLSQQLQETEGEEATSCLHQSCQEAHRVAQELVDTTLPEGHDLRQAPLGQPHPVVIRLLHDLNDRLPEGYVYDPMTQRVVQYELPDVGQPMSHDEPIKSVEEDPFLEPYGQETG